jgi:lipopolysaccharide transport system ATP-binding protein
VISQGCVNFAKKVASVFSRSPIPDPRSPTSEDFWALKDVSFEVKQGERIGIIGRNGAGKSTLLKILSRITEPTTGSIRIKGRVASLLEVGTGFHPELTGRENIFLNGAILGMGRAEIKKKFDEIVDFAEIEKFLDTPVKRYSSGMYVRLAFAVAAHLEPEILFVDEVLAVGDAQFQKKCLGKMEDVSAKEGRTVLFVSHNMGAISSLCNRSILIIGGSVELYDSSQAVIDTYLASFCATDTRLLDRKDRQGTGDARIEDIFIIDKNNNKVEMLISGNDYSVVMKYRNTCSLKSPNFKISIYNSTGQLMTQLNNYSYGYVPHLPKGDGVAKCKIPSIPLGRGVYRINVSVSTDIILDHLENCLTFKVENGDYFGTGRNVDDLKEICLLRQAWDIKSFTDICN